MLKIHQVHRTLNYPNIYSRILVLSRRFETDAFEQKSNIKAQVKSLYRNLIYLSRDWHTDLRPQIKNAFMKNKDTTDVEEIKKLIAKGEYVCREITATYTLKKYRALKRRYYREDEKSFSPEL